MDARRKGTEEMWRCLSWPNFAAGGTVRNFTGPDKSMIMNNMNTCSPACSLPINSPQKILHGETWRATVTFRLVPDGGTEPLPMNLTGFTDLHACIYAKSPTNELGQIDAEIVDAENGVVQLVLPEGSEFFANNPPATYQWQFSMRNMDGDRKTYISSSTFEVRPNE